MSSSYKGKKKEENRKNLKTSLPKGKKKTNRNKKKIPNAANYPTDENTT